MIPLYELKLTCSSYFPVSAFIDLYIVFQVDLYPATVGLVVKSDLFKGGADNLKKKNKKKNYILYRQTQKLNIYLPDPKANI